MADKKIKKLVTASLLLAVGIALPVLFHVLGSQVAGQSFLPMHIPVLLAGFILGPVWGAFLGLLTPALGFAIDNMPVAARLPFMMGELAAYGAAAGVMYRTLKFSEKRGGVYISLLSAMVFGRLVYALMLATAAGLLGIKCGGAAAAVTATATGLPGIAAQIVLIPAVVYAVKRAGYFND